MVSLWTELQESGIASCRDALRRNRSICAVGPTGFGKTRISTRIAKMAADKGSRWVFLTHRKMLFGQTVDAFNEAGLDFGCIASDWDHWENPNATGQICMIQTLHGRLKRGCEEGVLDWSRLPPADLLIIDEWHANANGISESIFRKYREQKARIVGLTATPLGLSHVCDELVVMANNSQCREVKALLPAHVYAPDEVDLKDVKPVSAGEEFSQIDLARAFKRQQVVGRVYEHWLKLNPDQLPAIGFAPGVQESMWFCDEFIKRGVKCAHIDGEKVYLGERDEAGEPIIYTDKMKRDEVAEGSRNGEFKVVWNRFVLREGVDWPWLYHLMVATAFGDPKGWLQVCGRVLRYWPAYDHVIIQDHGGNVFRPGLGNPNADREWRLEDTSASVVREARERMERDADEQMKNCPECSRPMESKAWHAAGNSCPWCGYRFKMSVRNVIQTDGTLKKIRGNSMKVKPPPPSDAQKAWNSIVFPSRNSKRKHSSNFKQAFSRFHSTFPHFKIVVGRESVKCVHVHTGESCVLRNIPKGGSPYWEQEVRNVDFRKINGG